MIAPRLPLLVQVPTLLSRLQPMLRPSPMADTLPPPPVSEPTAPQEFLPERLPSQPMWSEEYATQPAVPHPRRSTPPFEVGDDDDGEL